VEHLNRAHQADLEIRGDGRTVVGIAVPYDTPTLIRDHTGSYNELFRRGSFAKTITERGDRVKFLAQHDRRSMPLGRATLLREDAAGLYGEFRVSATQAGDEALELIRDGALDGLSIGFRPIQQKRSKDGTMVERTEAGLDEVSAVTFPAYDGAVIAGVRAADLLGQNAADLLAAIAEDPELAELARSLFSDTPTPEAAPGTSDAEAVELIHEAARSTSGISTNERERRLTLLSL
jgi:HK97 family phage prohead protease